ncbi:MAG: RNA polymerase subunit sigma-70 [Pyrinomonadaceae bacterium]|nr:RNA polymerase subunit sigma-70 [Phycisphaerales bacterium]
MQPTTEGIHQLPDAVYTQLRGLAAAMLEQESPGHTLQPTALVHEAYIRLAAQRELSGATREQILALGAIMIRRVLVDHYRHKTALKRGGENGRRVEYEASTLDPRDGTLAIEEALAKLETLDPGKARIVILKFYGGMSVEQIASLQGESPRKVARDWAFARAWLGMELSA